MNDLQELFAKERFAAREQLVEHHAHRPDVRAGIDFSGAAGLLRRHVVGGAERGAGAGRDTGVGHLELGDAEVENLDQIAAVAGVGHEQVLGLEIAVNDRRLVRDGQTRHA